MDDKVLAERLDGHSIPLDPGERRFAFEALGFPRVEKMVVLRMAEKDRVIRSCSVHLSRPANGDCLNCVVTEWTSDHYGALIENGTSYTVNAMRS
jgi:hypothetical protein